MASTNRKGTPMQMNVYVRKALTVTAALGFVTAGAAPASAGDHVVSSAFTLASKLNFSVGFDCSISALSGAWMSGNDVVVSEW
jgi:hypothetical protein